MEQIIKDGEWSPVNDGFGIVGYSLLCPYCDTTIEMFCSSNDFESKHKCGKCNKVFNVVKSPE